MFLEIELKLSIAPKDVNLLLQHPLLTQLNTPPAHTEQLISRYFDTPDLALWQQGLCLRVRESEGRTLQTLKTRGKQVGAIQHRHEWDQLINQNMPDIQQFEDLIVIDKLKHIIGKNSLLELFHTNFHRTQWDLNTEKNTLVELVLDQGLIKTASKQTDLHEIELELKEGEDIQTLYKIAELLKQTIPLSVETRSKAERGYSLYKQ